MKFQRKLNIGFTIRQWLIGLRWNSKLCSEIVGFDSTNPDKFNLLCEDSKGKFRRNLSERETAVALFLLRAVVRASRAFSKPFIYYRDKVEK